MGFFHIEKFDNLNEWDTVPSFPEQFQLFEDSTPELLEPFSGKSIMGIKLNSRTHQDAIYLEKKYPYRIRAKYRDELDTWIDFPILRFTYKASLTKEFPFIYKTVSEFFVSIEIFADGASKGEWYLPLVDTGCNFSYTDIDLSRLFIRGEEFWFDAVKIKVIQNPGNTKIFFGALYILEEEPSHNMAVAIADMLHLKYRKQLWTVADQAKKGSRNLSLNTSVDLYDNIAIAIGDPDGLYELHVVDGIKQRSDRVEVSFSEEFDRGELAYEWPAGTEVWFVVPAIWYDLRASEAIFPLIYISTESPNPSEEYGRTTAHRDSYRVLDNGECEVAYTTEKSLEAVTISANVQLFSPTREYSEPVYKMIRSILTNQQLLWVAGQYCQFVIEDYGTDPSLDEPLVAKNSFSINTILFERVYKRNYQKYPLFKDIKLDLGIEVKQDVNYRIL